MPWQLTGNNGTNPNTDFLGTTDNQPLVIKTNGTEALHITTNGSVGIGTTSPKGTLHIADNGDPWSSWNLGTNLLIEGGTVARHPVIGIFDAGNANPWVIGNFGGDLNFAQMPALGDTTIPPTIPLMIDKAGNIGIGTTSPKERLTVVSSAPGVAAVRGENLSFINTGDIPIGATGVEGVGSDIGVKGTGGIGVFGEAQPSGTGVEGRSASGDGVRGTSSSGTGVSGWTNDPAGVGIVAHSAGDSLSNLGLRVVGKAEISGEIVVGAALRTQSAGNANIRLGADTANNDIEIGSANSGIREIAFWNAGGGFLMDIRAGKVSQQSDAKLKTNIRPLTDVLEKLEQIRGVSFEWNDMSRSPSHPTGAREIGVIAQEVEAIFPELTTTWGAEGYKAVDYGRLAAVLVEAVKELRAENGTLQSRLEALERLAISSKAGAEVVHGETVEA
jgi:hypothetical protein